MNKIKANKIIELLDNIDIYVCADDLKDVNTSDELRDYLESNDAFECEVIYYSNAMAYLLENDASLTESIELAIEYGYELKNINSELLATLLKCKNIRDEFENLVSVIDEILV